LILDLTSESVCGPLDALLWQSTRFLGYQLHEIKAMTLRLEERKIIFGIGGHRLLHPTTKASKPLVSWKLMIELSLYGREILWWVNLWEGL